MVFNGHSDHSPRDSSPPTPDPLNWQTLPEVGDYGAITMSVEPASDQGGVGVQYFFENTVTNTNSGWQFENVWTEDGLSHDTLHTFRVKARDTSPDLNESTQWTTAESVRTPAIPSGMLLITGFQSPLFSNGQSNPDFAGWALTNGGSVKTRLQGGDGVPGDSTADGSNQVIQFAYTNAEIQYAISHEWSASDTYILSLNAAPRSGVIWQRYVGLEYFNKMALFSGIPERIFLGLSERHCPLMSALVIRIGRMNLILTSHLRLMRVPSPAELKVSYCFEVGK